MNSQKTGLTVALLMLVLCVSVWAEFDSRLDRLWDLWKKTYNKKYHTEVEELDRRAVWEKNVMQIHFHNLEENLGLHSYKVGINHLSDLTKEEMLKIYAPLRLPKDFKMTPTHLKVKDGDLPSSVDWRKSGYVTSVKNQGACGSCWAFSTVGSLEGFWAKTTGILVDLSPQNLVDCSKDFGPQGCRGGWMHEALQYVIVNQGIASNASYPYVARDQTCRYKSSLRAAGCSSYSFVNRTEADLKVAVATVGPIAIVIDASGIFHYSSGVYYNPDCGKQSNHAVLLVGYGTDVSGMDYWLIKNSWGQSWGEAGYIRMARNKNQMCGISLYSVYPE